MRVCGLLDMEDDVVTPIVHFVGFRGEEYWAAVKVWGHPAYIHRGWDRRAQRDIADCDTVVFANGCDAKGLAPRNFNDINE
jgi:hypothetical protein